MESIENIRRNVIVEIKEKIKKNPGYIHPCNKEFQEDSKRYGFDSIGIYVIFLQQNGIIKNVAHVNHEIMKKTIENAGCKTRTEYNNKCAQKKGFKDNAESIKEWRYKTGRNLPREFHKDLPQWFGDFTEDLMIHRYPDAIKMPPNNPGFDWLWKGIKIDNKARCLDHKYNWTGCAFPILRNNIADIFILSGWDTRDSLNPLFILEFKKNDLIRYGKGIWKPKIEFWKRSSFTITYPEGLEEFEEYQIDIDWLRELCDREKII